MLSGRAGWREYISASQRRCLHQKFGTWTIGDENCSQLKLLRYVTQWMEATNQNGSFVFFQKIFRVYDIHHKENGDSLPYVYGVERGSRGRREIVQII